MSTPRAKQALQQVARWLCVLAVAALALWLVQHFGTTGSVPPTSYLP